MVGIVAGNTDTVLDVVIAKSVESYGNPLGSNCFGSNDIMQNSKGLKTVLTLRIDINLAEKVKWDSLFDTKNCNSLEN